MNFLFFALVLLSSYLFLPSYTWAQDDDNIVLESLLNLETQNDKDSATSEDNFNLPEDLSSIPDEFLDEAIAFNERCLKEPPLFQNYDCDCLASRYLDVRLSSGIERSPSSILLEIEASCKNTTNIAGLRYQKCLGTAVMRPGIKDVEAYCECYANTFAKIYEISNRKPSARLTIAIHERASISCSKPELAKKLYPNISQWKKPSHRP